MINGEYIYSKGMLVLEDKGINLSATENEIFNYLLHKNQYIKAKELLEAIGKSNFENNRTSIGIYIKRINKKLAGMARIYNKFGFGYKLIFADTYRIVNLQRSYKFEYKDITNFYTLLQHYDELSCNVGIVGSKEKYIQYVYKVIGRFSKSNAKIIKNTDETKFSIFVDDMEYTYIHLRSYEDLQNLKFKKFV